MTDEPRIIQLNATTPTRTRTIAGEPCQYYSAPGTGVRYRIGSTVPKTLETLCGAASSHGLMLSALCRNTEATDGRIEDLERELELRTSTIGELEARIAHLETVLEQLAARE